MEILETVGTWLDTNGKTIYEAERMAAEWTTNLNYTRRGNTLYMHVCSWPGHTPAAEWLDFYKPEVVVASPG